MPKIFNRAIQVGGEDQKVGTPVVTVIRYDADGYVAEAKGATIPTDGDKGYAVGCDFTHTGGSAGLYNYRNEGTASSAAFRVAGSLRPTETVTTTNVITAAENGKTFYLNSTTEFVSTLPAPAAGLKYKFVVVGAPSGASYTVVTASSANIIVGQIVTNDFSGTTDSDFEASGGDTITFVDAKAVKGDWVEVESDGTNWYAHGACSVFDAITITTAS